MQMINIPKQSSDNVSKYFHYTKGKRHMCNFIFSDQFKHNKGTLETELKKTKIHPIKDMMLIQWRKHKNLLMNWMICRIIFRMKLVSLCINTNKLLAVLKRVVLIMMNKTLGLIHHNIFKVTPSNIIDMLQWLNSKVNKSETDINQLLTNLYVCSVCIDNNVKTYGLFA